jgi:RNA polymerase sigma-70 factor, ECF subfamily
MNALPGGTPQADRCRTIIHDQWELVVTICRRHLSGRPDAEVEDAVQETFARLLDTDVTRIREPAAWLIVVATRVCARSLRQSYRLPTVPLASPTISDGIDPEDLVLQQRSFGELLAVLSVVEQEVLILRYSHRLAYDQIATRLGLTPSNARQVAHRARERLRDALLLIDPE